MSLAFPIPVKPVIQPPPMAEEILTDDERSALKARIKALMKQQDAVLVAHYYTSADLQDLAEAAACRTRWRWRASATPTQPRL
jgi:quinolinate synthase